LANGSPGTVLVATPGEQLRCVCWDAGARATGTRTQRGWAERCADCREVRACGISDPWAGSPDDEQDRLPLTSSMADPHGQAQQKSPHHTPAQGEDGTYSVEGGSRQAGGGPGHDFHVAENRQRQRRAPGQKHAVEELCDGRG
jgi:hypothetical protein